jgi:cytochrome c oxidase subunit II
MSTKETIRPGMKFPLAIAGVLAVFLLVLGAQGYLFLKYAGQHDGVVEINMRVVEGQWKWEPNEIRAPYGSKVIINIKNEDGHAHGFAINELGVNRNLPGGQTTKVEFIANRIGEFEFYCSVLCGAGHFTQTGKIIVAKPDGTD